MNISDFSTKDNIENPKVPLPKEILPKASETDKEIDSIAKILLKNSDDKSIKKNVESVKNRFQLVSSMKQPFKATKLNLLKDCQILTRLIEMKLKQETDPEKKVSLKSFYAHLKQLEESIQKSVQNEKVQTIVKKDNSLSEEIKNFSDTAGNIPQKQLRLDQSQLKNRLSQINKNLLILLFKFNVKYIELLQFDKDVNPEKLKTFVEDIKVIEGVVDKLNLKYVQYIPNTESILKDLKEKREYLENLSASIKEEKPQAIKAEKQEQEPVMGMEGMTLSQASNILDGFKTEFEKIKNSDANTEQPGNITGENCRYCPIHSTFQERKYGSHCK